MLYNEQLVTELSVATKVKSRVLEEILYSSTGEVISKEGATVSRVIVLVSTLFSMPNVFSVVAFR